MDRNSSRHCETFDSGDWLDSRLARDFGDSGRSLDPVHHMEWGSDFGIDGSSRLNQPISISRSSGTAGNPEQDRRGDQRDTDESGKHSPAIAHHGPDDASENHGSDQRMGSGIGSFAG